jgi:hypothetical protein
MPESFPSRYRRLLRSRVEKFLTNEENNQSLASTLDEWRRRHWQPYLFGGVLRDLLVFGLRKKPRDVDIVVANGSAEELRQALRLHIKRENRFGGFQLQVNRWNLDVWPLGSTWAFAKNTDLEPNPENLPKTTFLNVEAIAVAIDEKGLVGDIFEYGFFEGIQSRTLQINLKDNPYPALAAVRALATAKKLGFSLSAELAQYIVDAESLLGTDALVAAQDSHYGYVRFRKKEINFLVMHIKKRLRSGSSARLLLPGTSQEQLSLPY